MHASLKLSCLASEMVLSTTLRVDISCVDRICFVHVKNKSIDSNARSTRCYLSAMFQLYLTGILIEEGVALGNHQLTSAKLPASTKA